MRSAAKYCVALVLLILAAYWRGWNDGWYLMAGLVVVVPVAAFVAWRSIRAAGARDGRSNEGGEFQDSADEGFATVNEPVGTRESFVVGGLHGIALGITLSMYLAGAFALLQRVPWLYDRYYDADRPNIEAQLSTLEDAGNYAEAVKLIEDRLTRTTGTDWRRTLSERLYADLVQLAQQLPAEKRLPVLTKARQLVRTHGFDDTSARTLEAHTLREKALIDRLARLQHDEDWDGVVEVLQSELLRDNRSVVTARRLYDACCTAAAHSGSVERRAAYYAKALDIANRYKLPAERAQAAMVQIGEVQSAQNDTMQQSRRLAELEKEGSDTRQKLIQEMLNGELKSLSADLRLAELRRIAGVADKYGVHVPSLREQIEELDKSIANQRTFIEDVTKLCEQGNYGEAVSRLASAVRSGERQRRVRPLDALLLHCLREWCDLESGTPVDRADRLRRAIEIAKECGVDAPVLQERLVVIADDLHERERIRQRIAALKKAAETRKLISYLRVRIEEPEADWAAPYPQLLCEALLTNALNTADLTERCDLLQESVAVAQKYGQPSTDLRSHLSDAARRLREQEDEDRRRMIPVELPAGSSASIARVSGHEWPFVIAEIWVDGPTGAPIKGLQAKDFSVSVDDSSVPFLMQPVVIDPEPVHVAIVIDTSGSVRPVMAEVKSAVSELARRLSHEKALMKLIPFAATVRADLPWTTDATAVSQTVQTLEAAGGTALYRAIQTACTELSGTPAKARRALVVFTDGKNEESVGGVSLTDVIRELRANHVTAYAIGLKTENLEAAVLQQVASPGGYLEATDVAELGARFAEASRSIAMERYRLVLDLSRLEGTMSNAVVEIRGIQSLPVTLERAGF